MGNNLKTFVLLSGLMALMMAGGQLIGGMSGLMLGGSLGMIMAFVSFWFSDRMVLRGYGARLLSQGDAPELFAMVDRLRQRAGLPMPRLALVPSAQPNAFATGRSPELAIVAVTQGILQTLPTDELEGVIAHELAHIKNRDMLTMTIAAGIASMISVLPWMLSFAVRRDDDDNGIADIAFVILAPIVAMILQMAISRQREFEADRIGATIAGRAQPLAHALKRIDALAHQIPMNVSPALAPLAQVNPLGGARGVARLFQTHPPTEERVRALLAMNLSR